MTLAWSFVGTLLLPVWLFVLVCYRGRLPSAQLLQLAVVSAVIGLISGLAVRRLLFAGFGFELCL